jgi:hypothetical protein
MKVSFPVFLTILGAVALYVILLPLMFIWAINTLFPTMAIAYALDTWCAMALVVWLVSQHRPSLSKK